MANNNKPLLGSPQRIPPLIAYPMHYSGHGHYHPWTSNYPYAHFQGNHSGPYPYYHNNYQSYYAVPAGAYYGPQGPRYSNYRRVPPLLPQPPPLMAAPPVYGPHGNNYPTPPHFQGSSIRYRSSNNDYQRESPPASENISPNFSEVKEQNTTSPDETTNIELPLMPSVPQTSLPHPEYINTFKFAEDFSVLVGLNDGEMLIRGCLYKYNSSGDIGYLRSGSDMTVEVQKSVMYIIGRKMQIGERFQDVLAMGTNIKAIIKKISNIKETFSQCEESDESNIYTAVLAWFGEVPDVPGLIPTIERSKYKADEDVVKRKGVDQEYTDNEKDNFVHSREETISSIDTKLSHLVGYIWWACKDQGVMRLYLSNGWGSEFSGILFTADAIHFDNQLVKCDKLHFLIAHLNKCNVKARRIEPQYIHGMVVNWKAEQIDCGQLSHSLLNSEISYALLDAVPNRSDCEDHSYDDKGHDSNMSPTTFSKEISSVVMNHDAPIKKDNADFGRNVFDNTVGDMKSLQISCNDDIKEDLSGLFPKIYGGKHLTGHIEKLSSVKKNVGIAQWKTLDYGIVNILFKQNDIFVDLVPINKIMEISSNLSMRRCNLYVMPLKDKHILGFKIKLVASCGWVGAKPFGLPTPGEQLNSKISLSHLENDNAFEKELKDVNIAVKEKSKVSQQIATSVQKLNSSNGNNMNLEKKSSQSISKPSIQEMVFNKKEDFTFDKENNEGYQSGHITEVHCKMGKLMTQEGEFHYFYREQCYLFGICLRSVELWHVLVHGQEIIFKLDKYEKRQVKVEKVVIGDKLSNISSAFDQIQKLTEWCKNNAVTDCAKDILIKQIQKSVDSTWK